MLDSGLSIKEKLTLSLKSTIIITPRNTLMSLPMEINPMTRRILMRMILKTHSSKILDSELMLDSGLFTKRELALMPKSITKSTTNITLRDTLMNSLTEINLTIRKTSMRTIQQTHSSKIPASEPMPDSGPSIKETLDLSSKLTKPCT